MEDLSPVPVAQVVAARNGRKILIEEDVGSVVAQIQGVDPDFRVRFNEQGEFFVVYHVDENTGVEQLVTTAQELDHRLLRRVQEVAAEGYDLAVELDKAEAEKTAKHEADIREQTGDVGERLYWAARRDLSQTTDSISVPREV